MDTNMFNFNKLTLDGYDSFLHCFEIDYSAKRSGEEQGVFVSELLGYVICQKGWAEVELNNELYRLEAGKLMTIFPSTIVKHIDISADFSGIGIAVNRNYLNELSTPTSQSMLLDVLHIKDNPMVTIDRQQQQTLVEMFDLICAKHARQSHAFRNEITGILFVAFIFEVFAIYTKNRLQISDKRDNSRYSDIFKKFMILLSQHSRRERSVSFYADQLCICPKYLTTIIKNVSGRGVHSWIEQSVASNAKTLLKNTTMSIGEIAIELNFATATFFGQYFKRVVGITPRDYRNKKLK